MSPLYWQLTGKSSSGRSLISYIEDFLAGDRKVASDSQNLEIFFEKKYSCAS
jgi:hypothetical protein